LNDITNIYFLHNTQCLGLRHLAQDAAKKVMARCGPWIVSVLVLGSGHPNGPNGPDMFANFDSVKWNKIDVTRMFEELIEEPQAAK
jgi:hypothetical protein